MSLQTKVIRSADLAPGVHAQFHVTSADSEGQMEWFEGYVPFADGPAYHIHHRADELILVLEGEIKVKLADGYHDLDAGDSIYIPRGAAHTYTNVNREQPARVVAVYTPAGLQEFLAFWDEITANGMPDEATLAEIGARFGQQACGAPLAVELGLFEKMMA